MDSKSSEGDENAADCVRAQIDAYEKMSQAELILALRLQKRENDHLKSYYGVTEILTARLNQDCLESFFGWIRAVGFRHVNPTSLDFSHRIKRYLLAKRVSHFSNDTNCKFEPSRNIMAEILLDGNAGTSSQAKEAEEEDGQEGDCFSSVLLELEDDEVHDDEEDVPEANLPAHHRSIQMREYIKDVVKEGGIAAMASFLYLLSIQFDLLPNYPMKPY